MRGRCVWLREISPGEREMATSGGEREERQAWTHDRTPPSRNGFQTFPKTEIQKFGRELERGEGWRARPM